MIEVVAPGWNCQPFIKDWYSSLTRQTGEWRAWVYDDGSTDNTLARVRALKDPRVQIFRNPKNMGAAYCRWHLFQKCSPDSIIVSLDLDDYLMPHAFADIRKHYANGKLMTCGRFKTSKGAAQNTFYTPRQINTRAFLRRNDFKFPPTRSFHGSLLKFLEKEHFVVSGRWINTCTDVAFIWPLLKNVKASDVGICNRVNYFYRTRPRRETAHRFDKKAMMGHLKAIHA